MIIVTTKVLSGDRDFGEGTFSQLKFALRVSVILLLLFDILNHWFYFFVLNELPYTKSVYCCYDYAHNFITFDNTLINDENNIDHGAFVRIQFN